MNRIAYHLIYRAFVDFHGCPAVLDAARRLNRKYFAAFTVLHNGGAL